MTIETEARPPGLGTTLREARRLLAECGWVARHAEVKGPISGHRDGRFFGPEGGPFTLTQALWRASCWGGGFCHPPAAGSACNVLARTLWPGLEEDFPFTRLGEWARAEGRTQEEILRLFDVTERRVQRVLTEWLEEAMAGEGAERDSSNG